MLTRRKGHLTPKAREAVEQRVEERLAEVGRRFYEEGRKSRDPAVAALKVQVSQAEDGAPVP